MRSKAELTTAIRRDARVAVVVNAASRRGRRAAGKVRPLLASVGVRVPSEPFLAGPDGLLDALDRALATEPDLVVVGGGDGTLSTAVSHLAHSDVALGVLPLGTTNNFARSLELPVDPAEAVEVLRTGKVADVDLGEVHGEEGTFLFANLTSLGLSVQVARRVPHALKRVLGRAAYALTAAWALPRHQPFQVTVTAPGHHETFHTHQLNIANGSFHAGRAIAGDASIDDRQLVVYRLGDRPRPGVSFAMVEQFVRGARRRLTAERYLTASEVRVETDPPLQVDVDGEIRGRTPITITVSPNALRVMVPSTFVDT